MTSLVTAGSIADSLPPSVTEWTPGRTITDCSRPRVTVALAEARALLRPIEPMRLGEGLRSMLHVWPSPAGWNPEVAMRAYVEVFAEIPADLFAAARAHALRHARRLPSPAEILEPVRAELARRRNLVLRLEWVLRDGAFEAAKPVSREHRAMLAGLFAKLAASLGGQAKPKAKRAPRFVDMPDDERERLLDSIGAPKTAEGHRSIPDERPAEVAA